MVQIQSPQFPPELAEPNLSQAIRFFTPAQKKILISSSAAFGILLIFSGLYFYWWLTAFQKSQVDFNLTGPAQTGSGDPAAFTVSYWNNTNQILQNAVLTIRYPLGTVVGDINQSPKIVGADTVLERVDLGDISVGGGGKKDLAISLIGQDKSVQKIEAALSYKPQNTSSSFENFTSYDIAISSSALQIDFLGPESVLFGAKGFYEIRYKNNSDKVLRSARVEIIYPAQFSFISSDPIPSGANNNLWDLGDLDSGEEGSIKLQGVLRDSGQAANFTTRAGVVISGELVKFSELASQVNLTPAPLQLSILVNDQPSVFANPNDLLNFTVTFKNNSSIPLSSAVLRLRLDGLMYDFSSLKTGGFFSGLTNTITFNSANTPLFASLAPDAEGSVNFQIRVRSRYLIKTFRDRNFVLGVSAVMETPTVPPPITAKTLQVSGDLSIKVNTQAQIQTKGYYYDKAMKNSGPLPPRVNEPTTYTVHWILTNYSNDLSDTVIKATLPQGVSWTGKTVGLGGQALDFNSTTGVLTWNIGKAQAATGVLLKPLEAVFQVALTPSIDQVYGEVPVLGETILTAKDLFTGNDVVANAPVLKSSMPDDPGVGINKSRVRP